MEDFYLLVGFYLWVAYTVVDFFSNLVGFYFYANLEEGVNVEGTYAASLEEDFSHSFVEGYVVDFEEEEKYDDVFPIPESDGTLLLCHILGST